MRISDVTLFVQSRPERARKESCDAWGFASDDVATRCRRRPTACSQTLLSHQAAAGLVACTRRTAVPDERPRRGAVLARGSVTLRVVRRKGVARKMRVTACPFCGVPTDGTPRDAGALYRRVAWGDRTDACDGTAGQGSATSAGFSAPRAIRAFRRAPRPRSRLTRRPQVWNARSQVWNSPSFSP